MAQLTWANKFDVNLNSIGKKNLTIKKGVEVSIVKYDEIEYGTHRGWKSKLVLKVDSKIVYEKTSIIPKYDESYDFFLVPITKGKYVLDLNQDSFSEFAVAVEHGGNAPSTSATVYSVADNKLKVYKHAWYQQENGQEVIWDYTKAPRKCYYTSQDICEYL
ncbi:MAG: hypothetical protein KAG61_01430 [Bacteriovoracaceae bacterium]|nr:hypothetical protein [Bacteriovoracaceae bacterium]